MKLADQELDVTILNLTGITRKQYSWFKVKTILERCRIGERWFG
jgi:hypothetical protein